MSLYLICPQSNRWLLFSGQVIADSLWPHGLQHARLCCPSVSPGVCSNSCPLSQKCLLTISSSAALFSSYPQSSSTSGSFPISHLFGSSGQSIGASVSVLPMNIQGLFPLGLTDFILLAVQWTLTRLEIITNYWMNEWMNEWSFPGHKSSENWKTWKRSVSISIPPKKYLQRPGWGSLLR